MTRIFYLITELDIGGAEKCLYQLASRLDRGRYEPVVCCLFGQGEIGGWLEARGVRVEYLAMRSKLDVGVVPRLCQLLRRYRPHVVHTFMFHANIVGRIAARLSGVPVVVSSIRVAEEGRRYHVWLDGLTHRLVDCETCVSEQVRAFTAKQARIPAEKLVTVPNGVETQQFECAGGAMRQELGLAPDIPVITTIGRLNEQKGLPFLLRAAGEVVKEQPDATFLLIGAGPLEGELRRQVADLGLGGSVRFLGWRGDVPQILADTDVFVLASLWEGMPNVVLEAMASAVPVVATDVHGTAELVVDQETGLLVPPGEPAPLAEALLGLLESPERAAAMGRRGRQRVEEHFSMEAMVRRNEELYRRLLAEKGVSFI